MGKCGSESLNLGIRYLRNMASGKVRDKNMVEMMMCEGGCVNGCSTIVNHKIAARKIVSLDNKEEK
jgi:iron only hydrogenase large subunit-like protein